MLQIGKSRHGHWSGVQFCFFRSRLSNGARTVVCFFLPRQHAMMPMMGMVEYLKYVDSGCLRRFVGGFKGF